MKRFFVLLMVVALIGVAAGAWAAGANKGKALGPVTSGTVSSVTMDGTTLKSFVVKTHGKDKATITVTADTKYMKGKEAATAADVKAGAKVMVRLAEELKDNAGTAKMVRIKVAKTPTAAPAAK